MRRILFVLLLTLPAGGTAAAEFDPESLRGYEGRIIGQITIRGNRITREHVIRRELDTRTGHRFDVDVLIGDLQRLENLGIFSSVAVAPTTTGSMPAGDLSLEFTVTEMPWIVPAPAIDYTEQDGWSFGLAANALNLLGRDVEMSGYFLVGGTNTVALDLVYPWISGNHRSLELTFAHLVRQDDLNGFRETSNELTPWVGTHLGEAGRLKLGASWFQMRSDSARITLEPGRVDDFVRIGASVGVDTRDSWRNPHQGWWTELQVVRTGPFGWSSGNYWTGILDLRRFQPGWGSQTLVLGGLVSLQTGAVGTDFPVYLQYRMGGANSIRGYDITALGRELYGKNQILGTLEYRFRLGRLREYRIFRWSVSLGFQFALFADAGIAWNVERELAWERTQAGAGAGLRLLVPGTEMIRFDVAMGEPGTLEFHLAAESKLTAQRRRLR